MSADCLVLHVSNISPTVTRDQMYQLFSYLGRIDDLKLFSPRDTEQKFAFVKFEEARSVRSGQHLTNTVFIDRAIVCVPAGTDDIPDEQTALERGGPPGSSGPRLLPPHLKNETVEEDGRSMLYTHDPNLVSLGLPAYPPLPTNTESDKLEEIRRTVYVGNLPKNVSGEAVLEFFNTFVGEVMYARMATGSDSLPCAYAFVEFASQSTVPVALQNDGIEFDGNCLRIQHSKVAIVKPQRKTDDQALAEVNEAIKNQKEEKNEPLASTRRALSPAQRRRSRSRSPRGRRRSRSPKDRDRRDRDRERDRDKGEREREIRDRERDRDRREGDRSRDRRRERSKERIRSSSRDKDRDRRDRKKENEKEKDRKEKHRSRSRSPKKERKDKDKERDRDRRDRKDDKKRRRKDKDDDSTDDEEVLRDRALGKNREKSNRFSLLDVPYLNS